MDHCSLLRRPLAIDLDGSNGLKNDQPFRTLTCTVEYPLVTFFTLLTTFDILSRGCEVCAVDTALLR